MSNTGRNLYSHGVRNLEFIPFEAGTTKSIDIPREALLKRITLRFAATVAVAGGANSGTVAEDAVLRLIDSIELVGNGVADRVIWDGRGLYHYNSIIDGVAASILNPPDGNIGANPINCFLTLDLMNKLGGRPVDSILRTTDYQSLKLRIRWGQPNDMFLAPYDRTATIANTFGITPLMYETMSILPTMTRKQDFQEIDIVAANNQLEFDLPSQMIHQAVFFVATVNGVRSDAVINSVSFRTASTLRQWDRVPWASLRDELAVKSGLGALPAGCALARLTEDGMVLSGLNAYKTNTCKGALSVNFPGGIVKVRAYTDSFIL